MSGAEIDIRSLLEQDRALVMEILEASRKLVLEVEAARYWTTHSLETFGTLRNIGTNLHRLLDICAPHWSQGKLIFNRAEGLKLWNTSYGMWRALPPVRNKLTEQLARRRRERIMGQKVEEVEEHDPAEVKEELAKFKATLEELHRLYADLLPKIEVLPAGLAPVLETAATPANGQKEEIPGGEKAAKAEVIQWPGHGRSEQDAGAGPAEQSSGAGSDDISPV